MKYLIKADAVFNNLGELQNNIFYATCGITENSTDKSNYFAFCSCGEMYAVVYEDAKLFEHFITYLCDTANRGKIGKMKCNLRANIHISVCAQNNYRANLLPFDKGDFEPVAISYENVDNFATFAELCEYIKTTAKAGVKVFFISNVDKYLTCDQYFDIKSELEQIAHRYDCSIFAGINTTNNDAEIFSNSANAIWLDSEMFADTQAVKYIFNRGRDIGIFGIDKNGTIKIDRLNEKFLMRYFLPRLVKEPETMGTLKEMLFGAFGGELSVKYIYGMLYRATENGELLHASKYKYIPTANKDIINAEETDRTYNVALTALSDAQRCGKRERFPILKFGEYRHIISTGISEDINCLDAIDIIICAIISGKCADIRTKTKRKKILYIEDPTGAEDQPLLETRKNKLCKILKKAKIPNFKACLISNVQQNIQHIEEEIIKSKADFVFIKYYNNNGKDFYCCKIADCELEKLANKYNVAIIANIEGLEGENMDAYVNASKKGIESQWGVERYSSKNGNILFIIGNRKGEPFRAAIGCTEDAKSLRNLQKDELLRTILEITFCGVYQENTAKIEDPITYLPVTEAQIMKALNLGIIDIEKGHKKVNGKTQKILYATYREK